MRGRIFRPTSTEVLQLEKMREVVRQSRRVLRESTPDTFLGGKTSKSTQSPEGSAPAKGDASTDGE